MKTILIATVIGMICFQSCTKENLVKPVNSTKSEDLIQQSEDQIQQTNKANEIKNFPSTVDQKEKIIIIKCGTEIPNTPIPIIKHHRSSPKDPTKGDGHTPPIFIPNVYVR